MLFHPFTTATLLGLVVRGVDADKGGDGADLGPRLVTPRARTPSRRFRALIQSRLAIETSIAGSPGCPCFGHPGLPVRTAWTIRIIGGHRRILRPRLPGAVARGPGAVPAGGASSAPRPAPAR